MKKTLWITNIIFLSIIIALCFHYKLPKKAYLKIFPKTTAKVSSEPKIKCAYELKYFDFHYKKENQGSNVIMFGNSLMRHGKWNDLLNRKDVLNRGISGDNTQCMCERLKYLEDLKAKIWFIEGGINDLTYSNPNTIFNNYKRIVEFVKSQGAIPVINFVFYISPKAGDKFPERKDYVRINKMIDDLNSKLLNYANENKIDYIDLNVAISKNNVLMEQYTSDGVHLTDIAYDRWVDKINSILIKYKI